MRGENGIEERTDMQNPETTLESSPMVSSKLSTLSRPPYTSRSRGELFLTKAKERTNNRWGDFTKMNVAEGDMGGELDPHGATGNGNPVGGNVTSNITGEDVHYEEWMK